MAKKKRGRGRPKSDAPRVQTGWSYSPETIQMLCELVERYKDESPSYMNLTPRLVVEALLQHAHRKGFSFSDVFGRPVVSGTE